MSRVYERFDPLVVIRDALSGVGEGSVVLARDATYDPMELVTVIQAAKAPKELGALPNQRWAFRVNITLSTTHVSFDEAMLEAQRVADAVQSLTEFDGVIFSSIKADSEPIMIAPHDPSGAVMIHSNFSMIMRRKGAKN